MNNDKNYDLELPSTPLNPQMSVSTNHVGRVVGDSVNEQEELQDGELGEN